jgi:hypothetical protein
LVVNVRLERERVRGEGCYGFYPAFSGGDDANAPNEHEPLITVERADTDDRWALVFHSLKNTSPAESWPLPESFDPFVMQQFRFRKQRGRLAIHWEAALLCEIDTTTEAAAIGLYADRAHVASDMVRLTALKAVTSDK